MHTNETTIYTAILIAGGCISIILFYFAIILIIQQKKYALLNSRRVSDEITQLENERKRIAEDLHDKFGPLLFTARIKFASIEIYDKKNQQLQNDGLVHLDQLMQSLRDFTKVLIPGTLLNKGLVAALEEFLHTINSSYELDLSFDVQHLPEMHPSKTIHIYRIIQEIIFNTIKHSFAKCLTIEIFTSGDQLIISTADDGEGFNYPEKTKSQGQGLINIANRVDILKGDLQIKAAIKRGTCYYISIPYNNKDE